MNKVAFITGGTRGIGRQIAITLAENGYDIAVNYRTNNNAIITLKEEVERNNVKFIAVQGDVSKYEDTENMINEIIRQYTRIDVLVNNAGVTKDTLLMRMKKEDFEDVININLVGTFNVTKNVIPYMMKQKNGRIINISSVVGISGNAGQTNYSAAKGGVIAATKALAQEVAKKHVTVNAVAPGFIRTEMTEDINENEWKKHIPTGRFGEPEEVADLVSFLVSPNASYITGEVISINGGLHT